MKCVPRVNCNLEGVMVNEVLNYTPAVEMLRVPLIVIMTTLRIELFIKHFSPVSTSWLVTP